YWASLGELHVRTGKLQQAEAELLEAIALIEKNEDSLSSEADLLTWQRDTSRIYRTLLEIYSENYHDSERSFAFLEWYRAEPLRPMQIRRQHKIPLVIQTSSRPGSTSAFPSQQYSLKPGDAVITWALLPDGLALWLLDSTGLHFSWLNVSATSVHITAN